MLAQILEKHGLPTWVQPFADVSSVKNFKVDALDARLVCVSYFGAEATPTHMRYLIRRLKRLMPQARFLAGFWMLGNEPTKLEEWRNIVGADFACGSIVEATAICVREAVKGEGPNFPDPALRIVPIRADLAALKTQESRLPQ